MSRFGPLFYYSHDDLHNTPYISGPWSEAEIKERIPVDDWEEFLECGYGEADGGERYELYSAEKLEGQIKAELEIIRKIRAGEDLP